MSFRTVVIVLAIAAGIGFMVQRGNDPHRTQLPFGSTDLSSVEKQLAVLPAEERSLVEAYVVRSNGDVLTPQFADPDMPFTARTFGEAIALERAWKIKQGELDEKAAGLKAQRDAQMAPLREIVRASVLKSEIITRNDYEARINPAFYQSAYRVDKDPVFVTRVRIQNRSNERLVGMKGALQARDSESFLPMQLCWIDLRSDQEIASGGTLDLDCGNVSRGADTQQQDFVRNPAGRFQIEWLPKYVKLASGRELDSGL